MITKYRSQLLSALLSALLSFFVFWWVIVLNREGLSHVIYIDYAHCMYSTEPSQNGYSSISAQGNAKFRLFLHSDEVYNNSWKEPSQQIWENPPFRTKILRRVENINYQRNIKTKTGSELPSVPEQTVRTASTYLHTHPESLLRKAVIYLTDRYDIVQEYCTGKVTCSAIRSGNFTK